MDRHGVKGFGKETICEFFDTFGRFYLDEAMRDEQKAIDFYERLLERNSPLLDSADRVLVEHIILDESEHKTFFGSIRNKLERLCSGL